MKRRAWLFPALLFLAAVIVYLPALRSAYFLDDYVQASMAAGTFPRPRGPLDLYDFINDADRAVLRERGLFPWWSDPHVTLRFFRPLSSALVWGEHRLLGDNLAVFHLHSLLWWVGAVLGARALFRRLLPERAARFATVIFALAPCHAVPLAWLANRYALITLCFGTWALGAYLRWREGRALRDAALALLLFTLAVGGGEYALCFAGYVLAFEIVGVRAEGILKRATGIAPFALPAALYVGTRALLGYGTRGSGFYADPFHETATFLRWAPRRIAILLLEGWFSLDHQVFTYEASTWVVALVLVAAIAFLALPIWRAGTERKPASRWLLLGSFLSLLPVSAVICSPRLLGASMIGVAANVALLLDRTWFPAGVEPRRVRPAALPGAAALVLCFAHFVHGPATSWLMARTFQLSAAASAEAIAGLRSRLAEVEGASVVIVRGLGASVVVPWMDQRPTAGPWLVLAQTGHVLALRRDRRTLELVASQNQGIFPPGEANLFRSAADKVHAGDVFEVPGMRITILDVGPAGPRRARYDFDRDLEDAPLLWTSESFLAGYPEIKLPAIGFGASFDP